MSVVPRVYVDLSLQLVEKLISPSEFMTRFLREFKAEKRFFDERADEVLDSLFYAAEEFVEEPSSRPGVVGEAELFAAARGLLEFVEDQERSGDDQRRGWAHCLEKTAAEYRGRSRGYG
ncbi:colicin immunity domain-containing protein [Actinoplanes sp. NPDC004185]